MGHFRKRHAEVSRVLSVRFEEPGGGFSEESEGWSILDSRGPILAVSWPDYGRGRQFVVHCVKKDCSYKVPVFREKEERRAGWQQQDKILWSATAKVLRAYHLWNLGLSGGGAEPIWEVERASGWRVHSDRGLVRVVRRDGEYRVEHLWRDPWTAREELHVSEWQGGPPPREGHHLPTLLVSANGRHAVTLGTRVLEDDDLEIPVRKLDLRFEPTSVPPVDAALEAPTDPTPVLKTQVGLLFETATDSLEQTYTFTLLSRQTVRVWLTGMNRDVDCSVDGSSCTNRTGVSDEYWTGELEAGSHSVRVYPSGGGRANFMILAAVQCPVGYLASGGSCHRYVPAPVATEVNEAEAPQN